jgi:protein-S-isoprenylcysteine O-methyltransferase Ste14
MGVLSLVRVPPGSSMIAIRSVMATVGMMLTPVLIRPGPPSAGMLASCAVGLEFVGVAFSQVSRLYLGRRFGLLPANRGIVGTGPFRIVRHPVYAGWFMLTAGYVMAFTSLPNVLFMLLALLFMMWRIVLEEELLTQDPVYREYCERTCYRLIPSVF